MGNEPLGRWQYHIRSVSSADQRDNLLPATGGPIPLLIIEFLKKTPSRTSAKMKKNQGFFAKVWKLISTGLCGRCRSFLKNCSRKFAISTFIISPEILQNLKKWGNFLYPYHFSVDFHQSISTPLDIELLRINFILITSSDVFREAVVPNFFRNSADW